MAHVRTIEEIYQDFAARRGALVAALTEGAGWLGWAHPHCCVLAVRL